MNWLQKDLFSDIEHYLFQTDPEILINQTNDVNALTKFNNLAKKRILQIKEDMYQRHVFIILKHLGRTEDNKIEIKQDLSGLRDGMRVLFFAKFYSYNCHAYMIGILHKINSKKYLLDFFIDESSTLPKTEITDYCPRKISIDQLCIISENTSGFEPFCLYGRDIASKFSIYQL